MPGVKVWMGVGATIDYEAGVVRRAPMWMTRVGLEWVYRVTTEPKRYWRRYLRDMEYFWQLVVDGLGRYRSPFPVRTQPAEVTHGMASAAARAREAPATAQSPA